jgi:hypothetical protein
MVLRLSFLPERRVSDSEACLIVQQQKQSTNAFGLEGGNSLLLSLERTRCRTHACKQNAAQNALDCTFLCAQLLRHKVMLFSRQQLPQNKPLDGGVRSMTANERVSVTT